MTDIRGDLQKKLSDNLSTLEQLRYFERVVDTRYRIAQANSYDSKEYQEVVLAAYTEYLTAVSDNIRLRLDFIQQLQTQIRNTTH